MDVTRSGLLRRQRRLGPLAILMALQWLVGYAWFLGENGRRGWLGLVPTTALVWMVDDIESGTPLADALATRWRADVLWPWHQRVYAGRMMDRWLEGIDPAARFVTHRRRVAVREPLPIWLDAVWDGPAIAPWVIAVTPEHADAIGDEADVRREIDQYWMRRRVDMDVVRAGETSRVARVALIAPIMGGPHVVRRDIRVRVGVEAVPVGESVMHRVADAELIAWMRSRVALEMRLRPRSDGTAAHVLRLKPVGPTGEPLNPPLVASGCSVAMVYTIEHVGEGETRVIESGGFGRGWVGGSGRLAFLDGPRWTEFFDPSKGTLRTEGLVLRIRPNVAHALSDFRFDSVWDGEIVIRLDEVEIERVGKVGGGR